MIPVLACHYQIDAGGHLDRDLMNNDLELKSIHLKVMSGGLMRVMLLTGGRRVNLLLPELTGLDVQVLLTVLPLGPQSRVLLDLGVDREHLMRGELVAVGWQAKVLLDGALGGLETVLAFLSRLVPHHYDLRHLFKLCIYLK